MVQARDDSGLVQIVRSGQILDIFCLVLCILQDQMPPVQHVTKGPL